MSSELEIFAELSRIRSRIEGIESTQEMLVRAHADQILDQIWKQFDNDLVLCNVYLLIDGARTQTEIASELCSQKLKGASNATVSRKIALLLNELHLIELCDKTAAGSVYQYTSADRILGVSRKLTRRLSSANGKGNGITA